MNYISIDPGRMRWKLGNGKSFLNIIGNYQLPSVIENGSVPLSIDIENLGRWNFGNAALLQSSSHSRPQNNDWIFEPEYLAGLLLSISESYSDKTEKMEVGIITGLPGSMYGQLKDNPSLKRKFKAGIIGSYKVRRPGYLQNITIADVKYTQQAWGPIWAHILDKDGSIKKLPGLGNADNVLFGCINVGYDTLEIGLIEVSGLRTKVLVPHAVEGRQLSNGNGAHTIIPQLLNDLSFKFNKTFEREQALEVLENGGLVIDGQWQDYKLPDSIKSDLSSNVYNGFTNVIRNDERLLYKLILTGGGANIIKDALAHIPQVVISQKPQFDTVVGYERLMRQNLKNG